MDYQSHRHEVGTGWGVRRIKRIVARLDGHTHIYQFPPDEAPQAERMIKLHVEEGQLHPYAGLLLVSMVRRSSDDGD